jgi:DNA-binding transcriptional LysR family regulator
VKPAVPRKTPPAAHFEAPRGRAPSDPNAEAAQTRHPPLGQSSIAGVAGIRACISPGPDIQNPQTKQRQNLLAGGRLQSAEGRMDRLASMQVFVQVVDNGSFAAAAKRLDASAATVTHHVQALEDHLGVQLLNRTTRRLNLTEVGRNFYEHSTRILAQIEEAESCASALHTTPRGLLRINTTEAFARVSAPLIAEFSTSHPDVSFDVVTTDHMVDLIDGGFDLAIRAGPLPDSSLISRRLGVGKLIPCAAPAYVERRGAPQRPQDLADHNCLIHAARESPWRFTGPDGAIAVEISGNLHSNTWAAILGAALAGQGIALLPIALIAEDLRGNRLTGLLPGHDTGEIVIHAVYPASRHLSVKVRTFIDFLVNRLHEQPVLLGYLTPEPTRSDEVAA